MAADNDEHLIMHDAGSGDGL